MKPLLVPILGIALLAGGCGYTQSGSYDSSDKSGYHWHSLYRQDIQTIFVPIFDNKDYNRGLEFKLSKAVIHQIQANTPYRIADREHADSILEGEITAVRINNLSNAPNSLTPQEQLVTLTVNFLWKDMRSGRIIVQRKGFEQSVAYYPTLGEGQFVANQESAEKLAIGIVQELQAPW
jgi:hypothetical protein